MKSPEALPRWIKRSESSLAATRIFDLCAVRYGHPTRGSERDFYVIHSRDWVNVLALTTDRNLVLVNQFRFGIDTFSLETPGGVVDRGEDPVVAAVRELREETGYVGVRARKIGEVRPNPAILDNTFHVVLVEECRRTEELAWDTDEEIEISTVPVDDVFEAARSGKIAHGLVLNALFFLQPFWEKIKSSGVRTE